MSKDDVVTKYYTVICFNWNSQYIHSNQTQRTKFDNYKSILLSIHNFSENKGPERTCLISKSVSNKDMVINIYNMMKSIMDDISTDTDIGIIIVDELGNQIINTINDDNLLPEDGWVTHVCKNDCYIEYS